MPLSCIPCMLQVYWYYSLGDGEIAKLSSLRFTASVKAEVRCLFRKRWDDSSNSLHCAAFALEPEFQDKKFNAEVMRGLREVCKVVLGDTDAAKLAMLRHAAFVGKEGDFGDLMVRAMRDGMPAHQWWVMHGGEYPELQKVAIRVTAMVSSAGACERVWSAFDFVHSKKRNRLDPDRAQDLVYVITNKRLQRRAAKSEAFLEWHAGEEEAEEDSEVEGSDS